MMNQPEFFDLLNAARKLEETGDYRILRKIGGNLDDEYPEAHWPAEDDTVGVVIDVETTGTTPDSEVIELSAIKFFYSPSLKRITSRWLGRKNGLFHAYQQPKAAISEEITKLTGITNEMVAGKAIPLAQLDEWIGPAGIVIAHNAAFDRPFAERYSERLKQALWACSMSQVNWRGYGCTSRGLEALATYRGWFYEAHRSTADCWATLALLADLSEMHWPGVLPFEQLLVAAGQRTARIWAIGAPFERKDELKARGYRWSSGERGAPKAWFIDVPDGTERAEIDAICTFSRPRVDMIEPRERFKAAT